MVIRKVTLANFRSYELYELFLDPEITVIVGRNGTGKTNLLEALYVCLNGTSFRAGDSDVLQYDKPWWRSQVLFEDETQREVRFERDKKPAKQLLQHDQKKRFTYKDRLPQVLFEPNDLLFISGSPSRRRSTIDTMIGLLSPNYKLTYSRYERALLQRNKLLSEHRSEAMLKDQLFSWDVMLAELIKVLVTERRAFITAINTLLPAKYTSISDTETNVNLLYQTVFPDNPTSTQVIHLLDQALPRDIARGSTSVGPHRDDFLFELNGVEAKTSASRGETRSLILALKLAYAELLEQAYNVKPIILLDDVFSELDESRQKHLLKLLESHQVVITDTKTIKGYKTVRLS